FPADGAMGSLATGGRALGFTSVAVSASALPPGTCKSQLKKNMPVSNAPSCPAKNSAPERRNALCLNTSKDRWNDLIEWYGGTACSSAAPMLGAWGSGTTTAIGVAVPPGGPFFLMSLQWVLTYQAR